MSFRALYDKLKTLSGHAWPYREDELARVSSECDNEMMRLCDDMYFAIDTLERTDEVSFEAYDVGMFTPIDLADVINPRPAPAPQVSTNKIASRLTRLITRGGATMLLSGPSASFKSTFVRQAAADAGAALYIVQGTRSIEPIDLLGSVQVVNGDTRW